MKSFLKCLLILGIIAFGVFLYFTFVGPKGQSKKEIEEIKKGWYVEIIHDTPINVRLEPNSDAKSIGQVKKGEVYKALDVDNESSNTYYWYKIDYKGKEGWIASGRKIFWVNDYNNPTDIMVPHVYFDSDIYNVRSIDEINYKHLRVIEDSTDYTITHVVYYESDKDQYWINYTITDKAGKSSSKMQKIIFDITPDADEVVDFSEFKR